jgi:hypothetical protein
MPRKSTQTIVIALCTSAALIGLAFYQRYWGPVNISDTALYVAAAILCLSPATYDRIRCRGNQKPPTMAR